MSSYIANEVIIKHRIASYKDWENHTQILLPGELAIVAVKANEPHPITGKQCEEDLYLIKVGDGQKAFIDLPWLESSANVKLYGTGVDEEYSLDKIDEYLQLERIDGLGNRTDGLGSYTPAIKFVQEGLNANLAEAAEYTENYTQNTARADMLKHISEANDKTVIVYGEQDPSLDFPGDIYLKTIPERSPDKVSITRYGYTTAQDGNKWLYKQWSDGTFEAHTQIPLIIKSFDNTLRVTDPETGNTINYVYTEDIDPVIFPFKVDTTILQPIVHANLIDDYTSPNLGINITPASIAADFKQLNFRLKELQFNGENLTTERKVAISIYGVLESN